MTTCRVLDQKVPSSSQESAEFFIETRHFSFVNISGKNKGMSIELISEITQIPIEELENL